MSTKKLSVIIGFRDWGLDRLVVALRGHARSSIGSSCEIIVSDYGSAHAEEVRACVEGEGARVVRTEAAGPWSRSRALNAGVLCAGADVLVTTDADILFAPRALEIILDTVALAPQCLHVVQCQDLPEGWGPEQAAAWDFSELEAQATFRPRWGMGGMAAFRRALFDRIRGYDARMHTYGAEDLDFGERLRRVGAPVNWIDDPEARIYHIWHENSREAASKSVADSAALARNREILLEDDTHLRNYAGEDRIAISCPVASVVIATRDRCELLAESIASCLAQTVRDIEVVVVDDGSTGNVRAVIERFGDPRIRYVRQRAQGVGRARNVGVAHARADHIVIQDDDDLMLPRRVEHHLDALRGTVHGTTGGWIDFDDQTGEMTPNEGAEFSYDALLFRGKTIVHGASMLPRALLRAFPYDEQLPAGVDYNLFLRLAKSGLRMGHTRHLHILRRIHGNNLTSTRSAAQREAASKTTRLVLSEFRSGDLRARRAAIRSAKPVACLDLDALDAYALQLPPRLLERQVVVTGVFQGDVPDRLLGAQTPDGCCLVSTFQARTAEGLQRELVFRVTGEGSTDVIERDLAVVFSSGAAVQVLGRAHRRSLPTGPLGPLEPVPDKGFRHVARILEGLGRRTIEAMAGSGFLVEAAGFESAAEAHQCAAWLDREVSSSSFSVAPSDSPGQWCLALWTSCPSAAQFAFRHLKAHGREAVCGLLHGVKDDAIRG